MDAMNKIEYCRFGKKNETKNFKNYLIFWTESTNFWRTSNANLWLAHWFYTFSWARNARKNNVLSTLDYQTHVRNAKTIIYRHYVSIVYQHIVGLYIAQVIFFFFLNYFNGYTLIVTCTMYIFNTAIHVHGISAMCDASNFIT